MYRLKQYYLKWDILEKMSQVVINKMFLNAELKYTHTVGQAHTLNSGIQQSGKLGYTYLPALSAPSVVAFKYTVGPLPAWLMAVMATE